jgi:hypothetical protein
MRGTSHHCFICVSFCLSNCIASGSSICHITNSDSNYTLLLCILCLNMHTPAMYGRDWRMRRSTVGFAMSDTKRRRRLRNSTASSSRKGRNCTGRARWRGNWANSRNTRNRGDIYIYIYIYMLKKIFSATDTRFFFSRGDISITICVGILFFLLSWRFRMRSIQNRSRKNFEKYACLPYVDPQMLGHDRKNHTQKKIEIFFSTDLDVSDYGESESARKKKTQKKTLLKALFSRAKIIVLPYIYIYIYIERERERVCVCVRVCVCESPLQAFHHALPLSQYWLYHFGWYAHVYLSRRFCRS